MSRPQYLKRMDNGVVFNYSKFLWDTGKYEIYEPLLEDNDTTEDTTTDQEIEDILQALPTTVATKEVVEQMLDKPITVKQYNRGKKSEKK